MILNTPNFSISPTHHTPNDQSVLIAFEGNQTLLRQDGDQYQLISWPDIAPYLPKQFIPFELAHSEETSIFCPPIHEAFALPEGTPFVYRDMSTFRQMETNDAALLISSFHLWSWYHKNRFCGCCAHPLTPDQYERALRCQSCGNLIFPTIAPAVIVAITCGDRILLARNARGNFRHYALIAGFVEVGETLEQALHREVMEEVGLPIHSIKYIGNQPWGVSGSMMFAFHAQADDQLALTLQESEISSAKWFDRSELEQRQNSQSIAFELIERFRKGIL